MDAPLRPKDLADLLLASGDLLPRQRARDQQADLAGSRLKREVLVRLSALDPEPDEIDAALIAIVEALGEPTGPTRGVCANIRYDWDAACQSPAFVQWLIDEALRESAGVSKKKRASERA
jgi:hypothetical protein